MFLSGEGIDLHAMFIPILDFMRDFKGPAEE